MNTTTPIAILIASCITAVSLAGISHYSNAGAAAAQSQFHSSSTTPIVTLPTVEVRPTAAQMKEIFGTDTRAGTMAIDAGMPFYSFAANKAGA